MSAFRVALVSIPTKQAERLAEELIENHYAACVNVIRDVQSMYRWEGDIRRDTEALLIIKTAANKIESLIKYVRENHPHDIPEVLSLDISEGNPDYLNWLHKES